MGRESSERPCHLICRRPRDLIGAFCCAHALVAPGFVDAKSLASLRALVSLTGSGGRARRSLSCQKPSGAGRNLGVIVLQWLG